MSFAGIERLRPEGVSTKRTWVCTYCLGLRTTETCNSCGAPRPNLPLLKLEQPKKDLR